MSVHRIRLSPEYSIILPEEVMSGRICGRLFLYFGKTFTCPCKLTNSKDSEYSVFWSGTLGLVCPPHIISSIYWYSDDRRDRPANFLHSFIPRIIFEVTVCVRYNGISPLANRRFNSATSTLVFVVASIHFQWSFRSKFDYRPPPLNLLRTNSWVLPAFMEVIFRVN